MKSKYFLIIVVAIAFSSLLFADELDECFNITNYRVTQVSVHEELEPYLALPFDTLIYAFRVKIEEECEISGDLTVSFYFPNYYTEDEMVLTSMLSEDSYSAPFFATLNLDEDEKLEFHISEENLIPGEYLDFSCELYVNDVCGLFPRNIQLQANVSVENGGLIADSRWINNPVIECKPKIVCESGVINGLMPCDICEIPEESPVLSRGDTITLALNVCNFPSSPYGTVADSLLCFISYPSNFNIITDSLCHHGCEYGFSECYNPDFADTLRCVWFFIDSLPGDSCICFHSYAIVDSGNTDTLSQISTGVLYSDAFDIPSPNPFVYDYFCDSAALSMIDEFQACESTPSDISFGDRDLMIEIIDNHVFSCNQPLILNYQVYDSITGAIYSYINSGLWYFEGDSLVELSRSYNGQFIIDGDYCCFFDTIMAFVDPDSVLTEISETNNTFFDFLEIGYTEVNIEVQNIIFNSDTLWDSCDNFEFSGCDRLITLLNITDQNLMPIYGLASGCWETPAPEIWTSLEFNEEMLVNPQVIARNELDLGNSIVFVMDFGGSTEFLQPTIQDEVYNYTISSECCGREFGFVKYGSETRIVNYGFIRDNTSIYGAVYNPHWVGNGSMGIDALYDAIAFYGNRGAYPVTVVYITDSREPEIYNSVSDVTNLANLYGVRICPIIINNASAVPQGAELAQITGGLNSLIMDPDEISDALVRICDFIDSGYLLAFSIDTCGTTGDMDVCVTPPPCDIPSAPDNLSGCLDEAIPICGCGCDLVINKRVFSGTDTLTGRMTIDIGDTVHYILEISNSAGEYCPCTAVITDSLPGLGRLENVSLTPVNIESDTVYEIATPFHVDRIVTWEIESSELAPMTTYYLSYDYIFDIPTSIFIEDEYIYICNTANVFCSGESDPIQENNDTIICVYSSRDITIPEVICPGDYVMSGDTVQLTIINYIEDIFSPRTTLIGGIYSPGTDIENVAIDIEGSPYDTVTYTFLAPELLSRNNDVELISAEFCFLTYNSFDELQEYCVTCVFEVHLPPCYLRLDRNTVNLSDNPNDRLGFHISADHSEKTNIHIFDSGGVLVRDFEWDIPAGFTTHFWDMQDNNGKEVGSGVYFIVADSECFGQKTFKLAVIR